MISKRSKFKDKLEKNTTERFNNLDISLPYKYMYISKAT